MLPRWNDQRQEIAPGAVHVPGWLSVEQQRHIVEAAREWARGPAPMRNLSVGRGHRMSVKMVCLGWQWLPYKYTETAEDLSGTPNVFPGKAIPETGMERGRLNLTLRVTGLEKSHGG